MTRCCYPFRFMLPILVLGLLLPTVAAAKSAKSVASAPHQDANQNRWILFDHQDHQRSQQFAITLGGGFNNAGLQLLYDHALLHDGFLPQINNALGLEIGTLIDVYQPVDDAVVGFAVAAPDHTALWVLSLLVGPRWDIYFTPIWRAYLKVGLMINFGLNTSEFPWVLPNIALGTQYAFTDLVSLRLELNYPQGFAAGVAFTF